MQRLIRLLAILAMLAPMAAFGQGAVLQGGAVTPGRAPMYVQGGKGATTVVQDSGSASGATTPGLGLSEMLLTARGTGTPPYVGQGKGPLGTNWCDYDAPITNPTGFHYLCLGPNPGQMVFGAGGTAAPIPFSLIINGIAYTFPSSGVAGNVVTTVVPTTSGAPVCFTGTSGRVAACPAIPAATFTGNPTAGPISQAQNFTVQGLPPRGAPDANNDKIALYNAATGALNYVTPGLIASSATSGVSSLGGVTGPITLGSNLLMTGSVLSAPPGGSNGQIQYNNAGVSGGFTASGDVTIVPSTGVTTIQPSAVTTGKIADANVTTGKIADANVTNGKLATGAANTFKGTLNGTATSDLALTACTLSYQFTKWIAGTGWQCGLNPVLPSRAIALTLDLSAFSAITTQGYAQPGDGGGAAFQKQSVGAALVDYSITNLSITGNGTSGCTNATYRGQSLSSATGQNAIATVTVSGNVVSAIALTNYGGNKFLVGQSMSLTIPGCATNATFSVTSVSTPTGSFTDTASNPFQLIVDSGNFLNTRLFGAKVDGATDDFTATQNSVNFAGLAIGNSPDAGGSMGQTVIIPQGVSRLCGSGATSFVVPYGVSLRGQNAWATDVHVCSNIGSSVDAFVLCDRSVQLACFGAMISDMTITVEAGAPSANANVAVIFSNSIQQMDAVKRVAIYARDRSCVHYDTGWGGAALVGFTEMDCTLNGTNPGFNFTNVGTTNVALTKTNVEGSLITANAYQISGGFFQMNSVHAEGISTGVFVNIPTTNGNGVVTINGITGGGGMTNLIVRQTGSAASTVVITGAAPNGATNTYSNAGSGSGSVIVAGQVVL